MWSTGRKVNAVVWLFAFICLASSPANGVYLGDEERTSNSGPEHAPGELIVKFKPGTVERTSSGDVLFLEESLQTLFERFRPESITPVFRTAAPDSDLGRTFKIRFLKPVSLLEVIDIFEADPSIEYAELNQIMHAQAKSFAAAGIALECCFAMTIRRRR